MSILNKLSYQVRVSSVLNREVKTCGKQLMFDDQEETCWCSDQGTPQWIAIAFQQPVALDILQIQFQGGFAGKDCQVIYNSSEGDKSIDIYPEDINTIQCFDLNRLKCEKLKILFNTSTDFFGRIVVYKLDIIGQVIN